MAQTKGTRYIAQKLVKYFPRKYGRYIDALPEARVVLGKIKGANEKVTLKTIFSKVRTPRFTKTDALNLILKSPGWKEIKGMVHYFDLISFQDHLFNCPNVIGFKSKLLPSTTPQPIVGGAGRNYTYEQLFQPYVSYINSIAAQTEAGDERYQSDWLIMVTDPKPDPKRKGSWLSEVLSVDADGNEFDYGFNPNQPEKPSDKVVLSGAEKPEVEPPGAAPSATEKEITPAPAPAQRGMTSDQEFLLQMEEKKEKTLAAKERLIRAMKEAGAPWADIKAEMDKKD